MPAVNGINHLSELIGPPPRRLAWMAIISFIGLLIVFFILFFVLHFKYSYKGIVYVSPSNPNKLILKIPNRSEVDLNRINNGELLIRIQHIAKPIIYSYESGAGKIYLGNNSFIFDNNAKLRPEYPLPCEVDLSGLTLFQRFIHKYASNPREFLR